MENLSPSTDKSQPRNVTSWAPQTTRTLHVRQAPSGALNLNVDGRQVAGPLQGFGQLWQKTYRVTLTGVTVEPAEVIEVWKHHFAEFWPAHSHFFGPLTGIAPGEVAILNLAVGGMPLSTGVLVLYADDESFTLMTPQGHMFAGWITFSAYKADGETRVQAQVLMRAGDPLYELGLRFGGQEQEDKFWQHTLGQVARHFAVEAPVQIEAICVDKKFQWAQARNIWQNAALRTLVYTLTHPARWFSTRLKAEQ